MFCTSLKKSSDCEFIEKSTLQTLNGDNWIQGINLRDVCVLFPPPLVEGFPAGVGWCPRSIFGGRPLASSSSGSLCRCRPVKIFVFVVSVFVRAFSDGNPVFAGVRQRLLQNSIPKNNRNIPECIGTPPSKKYSPKQQEHTRIYWNASLRMVFPKPSRMSSMSTVLWSSGSMFIDWRIWMKICVSREMMPFFFLVFLFSCRYAFLKISAAAFQHRESLGAGS